MPPGRRTTPTKPAINRAQAGILLEGFIAWLFLPNVKDEPRRELARRVPRSELDSDSSFRSTFGRTGRDSSRRWLWRLVGPPVVHGSQGGNRTLSRTFRNPLSDLGHSCCNL